MPSIEQACGGQSFVEHRGLVFLEPAASLVPGLRIAVTTRRGGVSLASRGSLNLATHVGDDPAAVRENRHRLQVALGLPAAPCWLQQVHGVAVADADVSVDADARPGASPVPPVADAAVTRGGAVLAVLTADCLPVVMAMRDRTTDDWRFGVAHAGWRGLVGGVLEATLDALEALGGRRATARAWLGPAIGPEAFEVGDEVRKAFLDADPQAAVAFVANARGRWQADLFLLARQRLSRAGAGQVKGGGRCTVADADHWYSYRREAQPGVDTGRFATLAWMERDSLNRGVSPRTTHF